MRKEYICKLKYSHSRSETRQTGGKRICAEHQEVITHAVFTCDCTRIEDKLSIAQIARRSICKACAKEKKRISSKIGMRKKLDLNRKIAARKNEVQNKQTKKDDCDQYLTCMSKAAFIGPYTMVNCNLCSRYKPMKQLDPADFIGAGRSTLPHMGGRKYSTGRR